MMPRIFENKELKVALLPVKAELFKVDGGSEMTFSAG
jgi:hypothetical protein